MAHIANQLLSFQQVTESKNGITGVKSENTGSTPSASAKYPPRSEACQLCGGAGFLRRDVPVGHPDFGKLLRCDNPAHFRQRLGKVSGLSQLRPADTCLRLSDIDPVPGNEPMLAACHKMLATPQGWLYLHGGPGNAKTIALKAMCNHLTEAGYYPVVYVKFSRLVEIMRMANSAQYAKAAHFRENGSFELWDNSYIDTFDRLLKIKVLAIEEFDKARMTEFAQEFRFDFLDERYEQALRGETITLFASQDAPEALPGPLTSRVRDGRFVVVENKAGDARPDEDWPLREQNQEGAKQ